MKMVTFLGLLIAKDLESYITQHFFPHLVV